MEWIEANPLPNECIECQEEDCYNCDTAGKRWYLSKPNELWLKYKSIRKSIMRLEKQLEGVKAELAKLGEMKDV